MTCPLRTIMHPTPPRSRSTPCEIERRRIVVRFDLQAKKGRVASAKRPEDPTKGMMKKSSVHAPCDADSQGMKACSTIAGNGNTRFA
jgi:hypothetical protein